MPRRISVQLDLEARKYIDAALSVDATTKAVEKEMKSLGNQVDSTARDMDQLAVQASIAKHEVNQLGDQAVRTATQVGALDARIKAAKASVSQFAVEYAKTGDVAVKGDLQKAEKALRELERLRRTVLATASADAVERSAQLAAAGISEATSNGLFTALKGAAASRPLMAALVGGVAALAPAIGSIISGAIVGGVGAGGMIGGIASATKDQRVRDAFQDFSTEVSGDFFSHGDVFVKPIESALDILKQDFKDLDLGDAFAKAAPFLPRLAEGIGDFAKNIMPGFNDVMDQSGPFIDAFADGLANIGSSVTDFLDDLLSSPGTLKGFSDGLDFIASSIRNLGTTLHILGDLYSLLKDTGITGIVSGSIKALGYVVKGIDYGIVSPLDYAVQHIKADTPTVYQNAADLRRQAYGAGTAALAGKSTSDLAAPAGAGLQTDDGLTRHLRLVPQRFDAVTGAMTNQYRAAVDLRSAMEDLAKSYDDATGAALDQWQASIDVASAYADVNTAISEGRTGWDLNTEAGRHNQQMIKDLIVDLENQRAVDIKNSNGTKADIDAINKKYDDEIAKVQQLAKNLGATKEQADALAKTYVIKFDVVVGGSLSDLDLLNAHSFSQTLKRDVPGHASGTAYAPGGMPYLAGEHGPELIFPAYPTTVLNNQQSMAWRGGAAMSAQAPPVQVLVSAGAGLSQAILEQLRFTVDTQYAGSAQAALSRR